ncbi:MAG: hypothetical protein R2864_06355 [Syntrophotaleaceae bacterium]
MTQGIEQRLGVSAEKSAWNMKRSAGPPPVDEARGRTTPPEAGTGLRMQLQRSMPPAPHREQWLHRSHYEHALPHQKITRQRKPGHRTAR